jgi:anti-sigma B factor antagonist
MAAVPTHGSKGTILDFSGVDLVSSAMLGKLILLQRRVDTSGTRLRLCELTDSVRAVFKSTNLDRLFHIDRDQRESLEALAKA